MVKPSNRIVPFAGPLSPALRGIVAIVPVLALAAGCSGPVYMPLEPERPKGPLSLEAAVDLAFRNNADMVVAIQRVEEAQASTDEAISHYWPVLQFLEGFGMSDRPSQSFGWILDQKRFRNDLDFNDPGITSNWRTGLTGSFTLYDAGRRRQRALARRAEATAVASEAEQVRRDLALEVARSYYTFHKARETALAQEESLRTLDTHLRISEARQAEGTLRRSDVLAVKVRVAETREAAIVARNSAERAQAGLRVLLGLDAGDALELLPPPIAEPLPRESLEVLVGRARLFREELTQAFLRLDAAKSRVLEALAGYFPEITIFGSFGWDDRDPFEFKYANWTWGVGFLDSLTEMFRAPYRVRQARAQLSSAMAEERKVVLQVELDVKNALLDAEEADARHQVATEALALAEESLRLVEAEYREGAANVTRLLDAELALTQVRTRRSATQHDLALSRVAMAHATGEYPDRPKRPEIEVLRDGKPVESSYAGESGEIPTQSVVVREEVRP